MEDKDNSIRLKIVPLYALYKQLRWILLAIVFVIIYPFAPILINNDFQVVIMIVVFIIFLKVVWGFLWFYLMEINLYEDRMIFKEGVLSKRTNFLELYRVKDYKLYQSFFMRIFRIQNIILITSDRSQKIIEIKGVKASNVISIIRNQVEEQRRKKGVREFD